MKRPLILPVERATFVLAAGSAENETLDDVLAALSDLGVRSGDLIGIAIPEVRAGMLSLAISFPSTNYRFRLTVPVTELTATLTKIGRLKDRVSVVSMTLGATDATRERLRNGLYPEMMASARASAEPQAAALGRRVVEVLTVREADEPRWILTGDFTSFAKSVPAALETVGITVQFQSR